jgi:acetylglutamate kinase
VIPLQAKTEILIEALPYLQRYEGKTFVVKYGGAAMVEEALKATFAQDVALLKKVGINILVVHGGGKEITDIASRLGISSSFVDGQRKTDRAMMDVVQMVLAGKTNKDLVLRINQCAGQAVGLCGVDASVLRVRKHCPGGHDLGFVGSVTAVDDRLLNLLLQNRFMPVIAPIGVDEDGQTYNVNADLAAGALAAALGAEKLVYLSDVEGVLSGGQLVSTLTPPEATALIDNGTIGGGMLPKIQSAFGALAAGVSKVHLIDGRVPHALLLEIFTREGVGTEVLRTVTEELPALQD